MKTFKPLFYAFFVLTFTSCNDVKNVYGPMDSPCNPDWLVQVIVKNINRENYPITVYFKSADNFPPMLNGYESFSRADSAISLEGGGWKIEDDGKYKEIKYSGLSWVFYPYTKENYELDKQLVGKERKARIYILDNKKDTIFKNYISVRADSCHFKDYGWTLYDAKKIEATDTTCLTHVTKGIRSNCNGITFNLNKQH